MRRVDRGPCPALLDGPGSKGNEERDSAIAHHATVLPTPTAAFVFKRYKHPSVGQQLFADYAGKCAYCESLISHLGPADIDHFRPKSAFLGPGGRDVAPGYYWLGAEWSNLFPSCQACNRRSRQIIVGIGPMTVGKGTSFPLRDERRRARVPGHELHEQPLLLSPNQPDVERHLEFGSGGVVGTAVVGAARSDQGVKTIEILGLQREPLVKNRARRLRMLEGTVARYKAELVSLGRHPSDPGVHTRLESALSEIDEYLCHRQEYLTMTRQYLERTCPELVPLRGCTVLHCPHP